MSEVARPTEPAIVAPASLFVLTIALVLMTFGVSGLAFATPGDELWARRYDGTASANDTADSIAVSPDGRRVYVTGGSEGAGSDYSTIAYKEDGTRLWLRRYDGPGHRFDWGADIAVSPTGNRVYVTGTSAGLETGNDQTTIAYKADGTKLWVRRHDGPASKGDGAEGIAVSPNGHRLFITGGCTGRHGEGGYCTVAYRADGTRLWVSMYSGPTSEGEGAGAIQVSPDGGRIYITGTSPGRGTSADYATVAYKASGTQLWARRYDGPASDYDSPWGMALTPDGRKLFVTGGSGGGSKLDDYATVAYRSDGTRLWVRRYNGTNNYVDGANAVVASPSGRHVYVTGSSSESSGQGMTTIAYRADGTHAWTRHSGGYGNAVAVNPINGQVYVAGSNHISVGGWGYATVAYKANGDPLWTRSYDGVLGHQDNASDLAVGPDGTRVFVTGESEGDSGDDTDYATVAYALQ